MRSVGRVEDPLALVPGGGSEAAVDVVGGVQADAGMGSVLPGSASRQAAEPGVSLPSAERFTSWRHRRKVPECSGDGKTVCFGSVGRCPRCLRTRACLSAAPHITSKPMDHAFPGSLAVGNLILRSRADRWGRKGSWLAVLFHHLTDGRRWRSDDPFIAGLGVDMPADHFVDRVDSLARRYDIVALDDVLTDRPLHHRRRRLLLCFDDAYATVAKLAAPVLAERGLPWCFFLNPGLVGNKVLGLDNLVTYVANTAGLTPLARTAKVPVESPGSLLRGHLAGMTPAQRRSFGHRLATEANVDPTALAAHASLYLEPSDVRAMADLGVEIGNHTAEHVSCRMLDEENAEEQVVRSAAEIGALTGRPVRCFAYPYGSFLDATPLVTTHLRSSGHECAFVVQGRRNDDETDPFRLHRISLSGADDASNAVELTVLPRLRALRARLSPSNHL